MVVVACLPLTVHTALTKTGGPVRQPSVGTDHLSSGFPQVSRWWSRHSDLNRGPAVYETAALPLSYVGRSANIADGSGSGPFPGRACIFEFRSCHRVAGSERVRALFPVQPVEGTGAVAGIGSVLLIPELLTKPLREGATDELTELGALLGRLDLRPVDEATAELATALGAAYRLRAADAVHLATAINAGADRFITNNSADFPKTITEVDVAYPVDL